MGLLTMDDLLSVRPLGQARGDGSAPRAPDRRARVSAVTVTMLTVTVGIYGSNFDLHVYSSSVCMVEHSHA